ncbi:helix-turn-helix domain-containing protein [Oribacterium sp. oral taxon 102]|nr:helix-turn-helix domain-containing protein [Oribacterium sp. oral taxon 102]
MAGNRQYDHEFKVQSVKLAKEIGQAKAARELGIPKNTLYIFR